MGENQIHVLEQKNLLEAAYWAAQKLGTNYDPLYEACAVVGRLQTLRGVQPADIAAVWCYSICDVMRSLREALLIEVGQVFGQEVLDLVNALLMPVNVNWDTSLAGFKEQFQSISPRAKRIRACHITMTTHEYIRRFHIGFGPADTEVKRIIQIGSFVYRNAGNVDDLLLNELATNINVLKHLNQSLGATSLRDDIQNPVDRQLMAWDILVNSLYDVEVVNIPASVTPEEAARLHQSFIQKSTGRGATDVKHTRIFAFVEVPKRIFVGKVTEEDLPPPKL